MYISLVSAHCWSIFICKNCTGFKSELEKDLNSSFCLGKQLSHFACPRPPLLILVNNLLEDDFAGPLLAKQENLP